MIISVLAIDPGEGSGWALLELESEELEAVPMGTASFLTVESGELGGPASRGMPENLMASKLADLALRYPDAALVMEGFSLRKFSRSEEILSPVRVIAKVEILLWDLHDKRTFFKQSPEQAKSTMPNDRLKAMGPGFHKPGRRWKDANDAMRHAVTFLRRARDNPRLRRRAWPHAFSGEE